MYRSLSSGAAESTYVLTIDYRGFGYSTGSPTEQGVITDAVSTIGWAMEEAKVPPKRIVLAGQSLGTAVLSAAAEHFITQKPKIEFAGLILIAGFTDLPTLLLTYKIGGFFPVLGILRPYPALQKWFANLIVDTWKSAERLGTIVRNSDRLRLTFISAVNDDDIPYKHSDALFYAAANATDDIGHTIGQIDEMRSTVVTGDGGWVHIWGTGISWIGGKDVIIRQDLLKHGGSYPWHYSDCLLTV